MNLFSLKNGVFFEKTLSKRAPAYNPAKWWQHSGSNLCSSTGIAYVIYCSNPEFEGGKNPEKVDAVGLQPTASIPFLQYGKVIQSRFYATE